MKKFSLKFILIFILSFFSSFVYADGVFSKYYNGKLPKEIDELKFDYNKTLFRLGNSVAYSTFGKDFYVISYIKDNKVEYIKVINNNDTNYIIFEASYLPKDKKFMDPIVTKISKSINLIK